MTEHPDAGELADEFGMTIHYGREAMAEHIHEWHLIDPDDRGVIKAECFWGWEESGYKIQCPAILDESEINRRLNATQKLSAAHARAASKALLDILEWAMPQLIGTIPNITHSELEDYAVALEKD